MDTIENVIRDLLDECNDDYVCLAKVVSDVRQSLGTAGLVESTLFVISALLDQGVIAGQVENETFRIWRIPNDNILRRIREEWRELGREPTMGEIVWLTSEKGLRETSRIPVE
jgi:hypothetical protein